MKFFIKLGAAGDTPDVPETPDTLPTENAPLHRGEVKETITETHQYIYAGGKLLRETVSDGTTTETLDFTYDNVGMPYSLIYNNGTTTTTYYYITNLQGDVMYLVDANGVQVAAYDYDPYGKIVSATGDLVEINPLRYRGYYYDSETGFYYLQSRYYDPEICRFINADSYASTGQGFIGYNMFAYCGNNPIVFLDCRGYKKETYVFVYSTGGSFTDQAMNSPYFDSDDSDVIIVEVCTAQDFVENWNKMSLNDNVGDVYIYAHGGVGALYFMNSKISNSPTGNSDYSFSSLNHAEISGKVYLFSCHGGDGEEGNNVAWELAKVTDSVVRACTGSVSYSKGILSGKYYARKSMDLGIWKNFYYGKKWGIFGGPKVPKSSIL